MAQGIKKPDFFIVGAPKCGTSAMAEYLKQHSEIFMPDVKELHFFGSDLNFRKLMNRDPDWFEMTEKKYLSYFSGVEKEKRVGEASVTYLYSKNAPKEIMQFNSDADIIIMLRNPVEMIYSWHSQNLYVGNEDIENFKNALDAEADRIYGKRIPETAFWPKGLLYSELIKYSKYINMYVDIFGWDKIHIIIFDDLKTDTGGVYKDVLQFLRVRTDFRPDFRVVNPNKALRFKALQRFLINPPKVLYPFAEAFSKNTRLRDLIRKSIALVNTRYEERSKLDAVLRKQLLRTFIPEIDSLSRLIKRDMGYWYEDSL